MSDAASPWGYGYVDAEGVETGSAAERLEAAETIGRFWARAALVIVTMLLVVFGLASLSGRGLSGELSVYAGLYLASILAGLAAAVCLYVNTRLTADASVGWLSAALLTYSLSQLPLFLVDHTADPLDALYRIGPATHVILAVPTTWFLLRALRADEGGVVPRPLRAGVAASVVTCLSAAGLNHFQREGLLPAVDVEVPGGVDAALSVVGVTLAVGFLHRPRTLAKPVRLIVAAVLVGLAGSAAAAALARAVWPPLMPFAAAVAAGALLVAALLAYALLSAAMQRTDRRVLSLTLRAEAAEEAVRLEQERMHELRTTIAGIRHASGTLKHHADALEPQHRILLQQMMIAELERLERLLARPPSRPCGSISVDEAIRPLVVAERDLGAVVGWEPSGALALGYADDLSQIVHILLVNARRHAPGAPVDISVRSDFDTVEVTVRDHGPGVPWEIAGMIFERGVRGASSPGQGFGLHIARRLARDQGGDLQVVRPTEGSGASFVLTLRAVTLRPPDVREQHAVGHDE
jgi:signal transduction histidine kinase